MPTPQPLYSSRFVALEAFSGGLTLAYTVPFNHHAVVKCISITTGTNLLPGRVEVIGSPGGVLLTNAANIGPDAPITLFAWGMWTFYEGESLYANSENWTGDINVSGYLLSAP